MNKEGFFQPGQYASIPKTLLADTDVGLAAKLVYLGLQSYLDADKAQAWPGAADLQRRTGLSRRAVQQGIIRKGRTGEADAGRPDDTVRQAHPRKGSASRANHTGRPKASSWVKR